MITALALMGAAHAGGVHGGEFALEIPARTPPVSVYEEPGGPPGTTPPPRDPQTKDRLLYIGGAQGSVYPWQLAAGSLLGFELGVRGWGGRYTPLDRSFDVHVWEPRLDMVVRFGTTGTTDTHAFAKLGGGWQVGVFSVPHWRTHLDPALHVFASAGAAGGTQKVQVFGELRVGLAVRLDHYEGRADSAEGVFGWKYWPGSASASGLLGVRFGG